MYSTTADTLPVGNHFGHNVNVIVLASFHGLPIHVYYVKSGWQVHHHKCDIIIHSPINLVT